MKQIFKYFLLISVVGFFSCEKSQPDVEYSPIFPIAGEWHTHIYNEDGSDVEDLYVVDPDTEEEASFSKAVATLSLYNTSANDNDVAWIKFSNVTYPFGLLAKVGVDVNARTIAPDTYTNTLKVADKEFSILEGKIMEDATVQPSGAKADSIVVKFETGNKTYVIKGHRRTQWPEDVY